MRRLLPTLVLTVLAVALPSAALAQFAVREDDAPDGPKGGTYLKGGFARWQGDIFSRSRLVQWDVENLFDAEYRLTSANVALEVYFGTNFPISGFALGYRKDVIRRSDSGHMFSAMLFHEFDLGFAGLKAGGGAEWGMPSLNFDRTEFDYSETGVIRYRHTHPHRNVDVPFVGTTEDGAVYPFMEASLVQRPWLFLVEAGVRINLIEFNFDDYEVRADAVTHSFRRTREMAPYLFVNVGIKVF